MTQEIPINPPQIDYGNNIRPQKTLIIANIIALVAVSWVMLFRYDVRVVGLMTIFPLLFLILLQGKSIAKKYPVAYHFGTVSNLLALPFYLIDILFFSFPSIAAMGGLFSLIGTFCASLTTISIVLKTHKLSDKPMFDKYLAIFAAFGLALLVLYLIATIVYSKYIGS